MAWDTIGVVMEVGGTSAGESASLRVLGDRMETGWEHRTLCEEEGKRECLFQQAATPAQQTPHSPSRQVRALIAPGQA